MRPVTSRLDVTLRTVTDAVNITPRTAVGIPPSDIDAYSDKMRVAIGAWVIYRDFDPGEPIITGAPIPYVTTSGEPYVTLTGDPYVAVVR